MGVGHTYMHNVILFVTHVTLYRVSQNVIAKKLVFQLIFGLTYGSTGTGSDQTLALELTSNSLPDLTEPEVTKIKRKISKP